MKVLVIYESVYGNTEKIARSIAGAMGNDVDIFEVGTVSFNNLNNYDLCIIGAPTQGGRATLKTQTFMDSIPADDLKGIKFAAFDTRLVARWVKIFGYAADKIMRSLQSKGGKSVVPAEGFFVNGKEGPLKEGEIERSALWAINVVASVLKQ